MNGRLGCLPIFLFLLLLFLLPIVFAQFMGLALVKLRLDPSVAMLVIVGIFLGSVVNIPITRIARQAEVSAHPSPPCLVFWAFGPTSNEARGKPSWP